MPKEPCGHGPRTILVEVRDGTAHLRKPDGSLIRVPLEQLGDEDRQYVNGWLKKAEP